MMAAVEAASLVILEHLEIEGPGLIDEVAVKAGLNVQRLTMADSLPRLGDVDAVVVMGGPMAVYDNDPRIAAEVALLHDAVTRGLAVLGVCLGAQMLAAACGAAVRPGENGQELGIGTVSLTGSARDDPLFADLGESLPVFHWHGDTFDLPRGASHLARSGDYPNQAFRLGRAYGFQFHIEVDTDLWRGWAPHLPAASGVEEWLQTTESKRRGVLQAWLGLIQSPVV